MDFASCIIHLCRSGNKGRGRRMPGWRIEPIPLKDGMLVSAPLVYVRPSTSTLSRLAAFPALVYLRVHRPFSSSPRLLTTVPRTDSVGHCPGVNQALSPLPFPLVALDPLDAWLEHVPIRQRPPQRISAVSVLVYSDHAWRGSALPRSFSPATSSVELVSIRVLPAVRLSSVAFPTGAALLAPASQ